MISEEKFIKNLLSTNTMILSETPERWEAKVLKILQDSTEILEIESWVLSLKS